MIRPLRVALFALLALLSIATPATAQNFNGGTYPTISAAYAACNAAAPGRWSQPVPSYFDGTSCTDGFPANSDGQPSNVYGANIIVGCVKQYVPASGYRTCNYTAGYRYTAGCTAPTTWDEASHTCADLDAACRQAKADSENPTSPMYIAPGQGSGVAWQQPERCVGGCEWKDPAGIAHRATVGGVSAYWGVRRPTGVRCTLPAAAAGDPTPQASLPQNQPPQACMPAVNGLTMCIRKDGKHCATATTGKQLCWNPGETGTKTDGALAQKRDAGTPSPVVPPVAPPGTSLNQTAGPVTETNTITNGTSTSTSTTTSTNYTTNTGTDAGTTGSGEAAGTPGGTGSAAGSGNSVSGGACGSNYACVSTDPVQCAALQESQKARCAMESISGVASGTPTAITRDGHESASLTSSGRGIEQTIGGSDLDTSGVQAGSGGACPVPPDVTIQGHLIHMDTTKFCEWMQLGSFLVVLAATILSLKILGGS